MGKPELLDEERGVWRQTCDCKKPCCSWRCTKCGGTWRSHPAQATCACGEIYVEWVNYTAWRKKHSR